MKLININQDLIKKYYDEDKTCLYVKLIPYKSNTCIKAYDEEGNPLGDVEPNEVQNYINKSNEVLFINQSFNDDTGLFEFIVKTMF